MRGFVEKVLRSGVDARNDHGTALRDLADSARLFAAKALDEVRFGDDLHAGTRGRAAHAELARVAA